ncbi:MAG TPA: AMP-binding protein [Candidatus Cloacimonadota bacterium]|nr:AMP-binding protein [Candidatus Cloacimonadota bacterium]HPT70765.1 AMP-binding protein [Candidatus Cloacimonadota bacterium]
MITENFVPYLIDSLKEFWDLPAFTDYGKNTITYAEAAREIAWLYKVFAQSGIQKGDKITLSGKNSTNWAIVYLATVSYGAVVVPVLANFSPEDMQHIINHSESKFAFIAKEIYDSIDETNLRQIECIANLNDMSLLIDHKKYFAQDKWESLRSEAKQSIRSRDEFKEIFPTDNADLAAIIYTSGTTGFSKGVMLPHNSLMANVIVARENLLFKVGAPVISFLPLAHAYACSFDLLYPFTRGNHIYFMDKTPSPKVLLQAMQEVKPYVVLAVPLMLEKIYKKTIQPVLEKTTVKVARNIPLVKDILKKKFHDKLIEAFGGRITEFVVGGAALNPEVEIFLKEIKFPFTIGYGMTECGPLISYIRWHLHRPFSSGKVVDFLKVTIDSPDPANIPGEIIIEGEQVMNGYYKNPDATKDVLDDRKRLHTGDIGTMDKDNFVYIKGRSKNMILGSSGENIYPEEIEQKMNNLPYIAETLVVERNHKLVALVYPDYELLDQEKIHESELAGIMEENRKKLNQSVSEFSRIGQIKIVSEPFQKTPTQKIKRYLYH